MQPAEALKTLTPAPDDETDAWRIYHDAAAGVWIDTFAGRWLVQTEDPVFPDFVRELAGREVRSVYWRPRDKDAATASQLALGEPWNGSFLARENGAKFRIDFSAGYSCGIFLDQRLNRKWVREIVRPGDRVLNTFAYTGAFSVVAALGGAVTTTCDLSKPYLDWSWENFRANDLDPDQHFGAKGDAFQWMRSFARQERTFHGIVLDPPTFSRDGKKTFRTDRDYAELAQLAAHLAEPGGWMLCCANTHRLDARDFAAAVKTGVAAAGQHVESLEPVPMPPEFHGDDYLKTLRVVVG